MKKTLLLTAATSMVAPVTAVAVKMSDITTVETTSELKISSVDIRSNVQLWNVNHDEFTKTGSKSTGSFSPDFRPIGDKHDVAESAMTDAQKDEIVNKLKIGFVENHISAIDGVTIKLDWGTEKFVPFRDYKEPIDGKLKLVITANDDKTIDFEATTGGTFGTGELSLDKKTLTYTMSRDDILQGFHNSWLVYYDNWGVFGRNHSWRNTMDRFDMTIKYKDADYAAYTSAAIESIYKAVLRDGEYDGYTNLVSYATSVISDSVYEFAANYANAVIENDDNVLGWEHYANKDMTLNQNTNKAIMTLDGGPVPDADRLTMVMKNFASNYQPHGHIYNINEAQYGVEPITIIMSAGNTEANKYLDRVKNQDATTYATIKDMVINGNLSNKAAILLMGGNIEMDDQEIWISTGFAYDTIDADRAYLLGEHLKSQKKSVSVAGEDFSTNKYASVSVAGRSHGMKATLATIFNGRWSDKFVSETITHAFAEKNVVLPTIVNGGSTGYQAWESGFVAKTDAAASADGIDWSGKSASYFQTNDVFTNYENQPRPSIHYFNKNLDVTNSAMDNHLTGVDYDQTAQNAYNATGIPTLDSQAVYRLFNAETDYGLRRQYNLDDTVKSNSLYNDNMAAQTRRMVHSTFGYYDRIEGILKSTDAKWAPFKTFLLDGLTIEANDRDPNIGSTWLEEIEWLNNTGINFRMRDDRPNITWNNRNDDNTGRGEHHDQGTIWDNEPVFGNIWIA